MGKLTIAASIFVVIVFAGCNTLGGLGLPGKTPSDHVAVPGITTDGVVDSSRLIAAHLAALEGRSYTLHTSYTVRTENGKGRFGIEKTLRIGPDRERFLLEQHTTGQFPEAIGPATNRILWSDGNRTLGMIIEDGRRVYRRYRSPIHVENRLITGTDAIRMYLASMNTTRIERVEFDGWIAYRVVGTDSSNSTDSVDDVQIIAVIDAFGLVRELRVSLSASLGMGARAHQSLQYAAVGTTTVPRPEWVEEAINATRST